MTHAISYAVYKNTFSALINARAKGLLFIMTQFGEKTGEKKKSFSIIPAKFARRESALRLRIEIERLDGGVLLRSLGQKGRPGFEVKGCPRVSRNDTRLRERSLEAHVDTVFERERGYTCYHRAERRELRVSPREIVV